MFFISSRSSIRRYAFRLALKTALNAAILAVLIIIRPIVRELAQRFVNIEPRLVITPVLPPIFYGSHCNRIALNLQDMFIYATILGSLVYSLLFLGVSISQDDKEQVQAILGITVKGTPFLAMEVVHERIGALLRAAAYPVKVVKTIRLALHQTLRARLETMPGYLGFRVRLGVTARFLSITLLLGLGVAGAMLYHRRQSNCAQFVSCDLSFVAFNITGDRPEALANTILAAVLSLFGLQFLVCSLGFSIAYISCRDHMEARPEPSLLLNNDETQDSANHEDKTPPESVKDTLCDVDDGDVNSEEAASVPNDGKEDGLNQHVPIMVPDLSNNCLISNIALLQQAVINRLSSTTEDPKHISSSAHGSSSYVGPVRSKSLQQQHVQNFGEQTRPYRSSLSASSQEFVPRSRNRALCIPAYNNYPPHWAPAHPVSVRITAPVKQGAHQQNAEMVVSNGPSSTSLAHCR